jgi:hypothetical protein
MPEKRGRHPGPTGVGTPGPGLAEDVKEHLRNIAKSEAAQTADFDGFIKMVDMAASNYWATKSLQDQALPATVRDEIKAAHDASQRLINCVNDLGGKSRQLLYAEETALGKGRDYQVICHDWAMANKLVLLHGGKSEMPKRPAARQLRRRARERWQC